MSTTPTLPRNSASWLPPAGCVSFAILSVVLVSSIAPRAFAWVAGILIALIATLVLGSWVRFARTARDFTQRYQSEGRDVLFVYSNSPHWQEYIETNWVTRWRDRAVVLNRSEPNWQQHPAANLWRMAAGVEDHTPVAIVVRSPVDVRVIRFWLAFRDFKHGKRDALRNAERQLENALGRLP